MDAMRTARTDTDILRDRAIQLSKPLESQSDVATPVEFLVFLLRGERYGFRTDQIATVAPLRELCPIPGTPEHLRGITRIEGEFLTVVDLCPLLGLSSMETGPETRLVVLENEQLRFGILVERLDAIRSAKSEEIGPPLMKGAGPSHYFLQVLSDGTHIFSAQAILTDQSLVVRDE